MVTLCGFTMGFLGLLVLGTWHSNRHDSGPYWDGIACMLFSLVCGVVAMVTDKWVNFRANQRSRGAL